MRTNAWANYQNKYAQVSLKFNISIRAIPVLDYTVDAKGNPNLTEQGARDIPAALGNTGAIWPVRRMSRSPSTCPISVTLGHDEQATYIAAILVWATTCFLARSFPLFAGNDGGVFMILPYLSLLCMTSHIGDMHPGTDVRFRRCSTALLYASCSCVCALVCACAASASRLMVLSRRSHWLASSAIARVAWSRRSVSTW
jgi:hypothetical protein